MCVVHTIYTDKPGSRSQAGFPYPPISTYLCVSTRYIYMEGFQLIEPDFSNLLTNTTSSSCHQVSIRKL